MNKIVEDFTNKGRAKAFDTDTVVDEVERLGQELARITKLALLALEGKQGVVATYTSAYVSAALASHPSIAIAAAMDEEMMQAIGAAIILGIGMAIEEGLLVLPPAPAEQIN